MADKSGMPRCLMPETFRRFEPRKSAGASTLPMVVDHGTDLIMQSMPISKFKATCLATLERVRKTGRPLLVTRFGKPIAEIVPPTPAPTAKNWLGDMRGTAQIVGDITSPSRELVEWEATK